MSQRAWRSLHYFGYAVWALSLVHGVTAGTDSRSPFALARLRRSGRDRRRRRVVSLGGAAGRPPLGRAPPRDRLPARAALEIEGSEP